MAMHSTKLPKSAESVLENFIQMKYGNSAKLRIRVRFRVRKCLF